MSSQRIVLPSGRLSNFSLGSFKETPHVHERWSEEITGESGARRFLGDSYWTLAGDEEAKVAGTVGRLVAGITIVYPEFSGIGSSWIDGTVKDENELFKGSFLSLIALPNMHIFNVERTAANLVEATNEGLTTLDSPYRLPNL